MARIRTIKPEFPQSESMGRVSRDARLCFIMLWTLADDSGRLRGNSRMLASLLFPYDEDAPRLIDGWLAELDAEGCIRRYTASGSTYIEIANWLSHQKIDKPSASKIPAFDESSRILANPRERSLLDQGPKDQGSIPPNPPRGRNGAVTLKAWAESVKAKGEKLIPPDDPVFAYAEKVGLPSEFLDLAWPAFRHRYTVQHPAKRYADWRRVFRNAVEGNWLKLWFVQPDGSYALTTVGIQAQRAVKDAA